MNKKGSLMDLMYIMVVMVAFTLSTLIAFVVWEEYKGATNGTGGGVNLSTPTFDHVSEKADVTLASFDYLFVFLLIGGFVMLIASVFTLNSHPAFFWISFLFVIILLIIAGAMGNVYEEVSQEPVFEQAVAQYNIINFVMDRLPTFILFMAAVFLVALYGKRKFDAGGSY